MATPKVIDSIVRHPVNLEFDLPSYRTNAAQNRLIDRESARQEWLTRNTPAVQRGLAGHLKEAGTPIGDLDLLVGSTALHHSVTLLTNNTEYP